MTERRRIAGLLLLVPIIVGLAVMLSAGAPPARWGVHVAAALLGWFGYLLFRQLPGNAAWMRSRWLPILAIGLVGSTLLASGIDGVSRWHVIGPLRLHCSALLTPLLLVVVAAVVPVRPFAAGVMLTTCQLIHIAQPDAGQATALGAASIWVLMKGTTLLTARALGVASAAVGVVAWLRPDPLPPAPFVEDIVAVAFHVAPLVGVLALLSMIPIILAPLLIAPARAAETGVSQASPGLALYLAGTLVVPCFGEFPIPLLGFGPSPIVGAFLGLAALEILARPSPVVTTERTSTAWRAGGNADGPHGFIELRT